MSFQNVSNKKRALQNAQDISFKQDAITYSTTLGVSSITAINGISANSLSYLKNSQSVNVMTKIDGIESKLNSAVSILTADGIDYTLDQLLNNVVSNKEKLSSFTDALNGAVGDTNTGVVSLMEQVSQNKADIAAESSARTAAESAVTTALGNIETSLGTVAQDAVNYADAKFNGLAETVTANKTEFDTQKSSVDASLSTLSTDMALRQTEVQTLAGARFESLFLEGEIIAGSSGQMIGGELQCGNTPIEPNFGIPMCSARDLISVSYIARTNEGAVAGTSSITYTFLVRADDGTVVSTVDKTFAGGRVTYPMTASLPDGSSLEVTMKSRIGPTNLDTRVRMGLQFRLSDLDSLGV